MLYSVRPPTTKTENMDKSHGKSEDVSEIWNMTISELLNVREDNYTLLSENIISIFSERLTSAMQYQLQIDRNIKWETVEKTTVPTHVTVMGFVDSVVGDMLMTSEGQVKLTSENMLQYRRIVRVMVPINLLQNGTGVQIHNYIKTLNNIAGNLTPEELQALLSDPEFTGEDSLYNDPKFNTVLDKVTKPADVAGFDGAALTDKQIQTLSMMKYSETKN